MNEDIESNIASEHYFLASQGLINGGINKHNGDHDQQERSTRILDKITVCVLIMRDGTFTTGTSAPLDPLVFDTDKGREVARLNALAKVSA